MQDLIRRFSHVIRAALTMGSEPQSFIGAKWLCYMLNFCPKSLKRGLALRIIAVSPHYFSKDSSPEYKMMSPIEFLEAEYKKLKVSRRKIYDQILKPHLDSKTPWEISTAITSDTASDTTLARKPGPHP